MNLSVSRFPGIAAFAPVVNGVGGNLVAIHASRTSSFLHTSGFPIGTVPEDLKKNACRMWDSFMSSKQFQGPVPLCFPIGNISGSVRHVAGSQPSVRVLKVRISCAQGKALDGSITCVSCGFVSSVHGDGSLFSQHRERTAKR